MTHRAPLLTEAEVSRPASNRLVRVAVALLERVHDEHFHGAAVRELRSAFPGCGWALLERLEGGRAQVWTEGDVSAADLRAIAAQLGAPRGRRVTDGSRRQKGAPLVSYWRDRGGKQAVALGVWVPKGARGVSFEELGSLLALLGPAMAAARASAVLRERARVDPQTGVLTRAAIRDLFDKERRRAMRYGRNLSILYIDLDNLKHVNDTFGHAAGDEFILSLARILLDALRGSDAVGRLGGDEFLVVLPETDKVGAATVSERVRASLMTRAFRFGGVSMVLSASVGCATLADDGAEGLLELADARMLETKCKQARSRGRPRLGQDDGVAA